MTHALQVIAGMCGSMAILGLAFLHYQMAGRVAYLEAREKEMTAGLEEIRRG